MHVCVLVHYDTLWCHFNTSGAATVTTITLGFLFNHHHTCVELLQVMLFLLMYCCGHTNSVKSLKEYCCYKNVCNKCCYSFQYFVIILIIVANVIIVIVCILVPMNEVKLIMT